MLSKIDIIKRLKSNRTILHNFGVAKIGLFGSVRRGEQNQDSDIDILIDFYNDQETFDNFMNACNFLEALFKEQKVDVVSEKGLSPFIGPYILKEVEYV